MNEGYTVCNKIRKNIRLSDLVVLLNYFNHDLFISQEEYLWVDLVTVTVVHLSPSDVRLGSTVG